MVRGPLFVLVANKPFFHRLAHMLLAYTEANEGHILQLLPCCSLFFFSLSPILLLLWCRADSTAAPPCSKRKYYWSGLTCWDGSYLKIFAAKCLARIAEKEQHLASESDETNILLTRSGNQLCCWCSRREGLWSHDPRSAVMPIPRPHSLSETSLDSIIIIKIYL